MSRPRFLLLALLVAIGCSDDSSPDHDDTAGSGVMGGGSGAHAGSSGASGSGNGSAGNSGSGGGGSNAGSSGTSSAGNSGSGASGSTDSGSGGSGAGGDGGSGGGTGGNGGTGGSDMMPPCADGFHPEGSMCVADPTCPEICVPDQTECTAGKVKRCANAGACWIWSTESSCGAGGCDGDDCAALGPGVTIEQWGTSKDDIVYGLAPGATGEVLAVGYACGLLDAQPNAGNCDAFLSSRNQSVADNWTHEWGSKGLDSAHAVARSQSGEIFVGAVVRGELNGDEGPDDLFVSKFSADGSHDWDARWGGTGVPTSEEVFAVAAADGGSSYAAGYTQASLDGGNAGMGDAFLSKLDADGNVVWSKRWGTSGDDMATGLALDSTGAIYVVGFTGGALSGQNSAGGLDAFLQKRAAADGAVVWTRQFGSSADDDARGVAISGDDEIFVTGPAGGSFGRSGDGGAFLGKWQDDGTELWIEQWGPGGTQAWAVALSDAADVYVGGTAYGTIDGATNAGNSDAFVSKWTQSGSNTRARPWSLQYGTAETEYTYALAVHPDGALYVGGTTNGAFPGYTSRGGFDLFVIRIPE